MEEFLQPNLKIFDTYDEFVSKDNNGVTYYDLFVDQKYNSISDLLNKKHVVILGEPGMGKTMLLHEIANIENDTGKKAIMVDLKRVRQGNLISYINAEKGKFEAKTEDIKGTNFGAKEFELINDDKNVLCLDGLDEVSPQNLPDIVSDIKHIVSSYPEIKLFCSCRSNHYKKIPKNVFKGFDVASIYMFSRKQIKEYLLRDGYNDENINKIFNLFNESKGDLIIQTPRYLSIACQYFKKNIDRVDQGTYSVSDLFELMTYKKLEEEEKSNPDALAQKIDIIKRVLEKLALLMEIYQTNIITKEELISFFDDVDSKLNISFLQQVNIKLFYERSLLKDNFDGTIQFENVEIQEYLAAKELLRLGHLEQVIFDLCIEPNIRQIFPSWLNTLKFLVDLEPKVAIYLMQLSYGIPGKQQDESFYKLITGVNNKLSLLDREKLFSQVFTNYQKENKWIDSIVEYNLGKLYDNSFNGILLENIDDYINHNSCLQQCNIARVIGSILENNSNDYLEVWKELLLKLDYKKEPVARDVVLALANAFDIESIKLVAQAFLLHDNKHIIEYIISACMKAAPNDEFSVKAYIKGLKNDSIIARYGVYSITSEVAFNLFINKLIEDKDFSSKFFEDRKFSVEQDNKLIKNLSAAWSIELEQKVLELSVAILSDWGRYPSENSLLLNQILKLAQSKNINFLFLFLKALSVNGVLTTDRFYIIEYICPILALNNFEEFIDFMKNIENGQEIAVRVLQKKRFYSDEESQQVYEEGRNFFHSEYQEIEDYSKTRTIIRTNKEENLLETFRHKLEPEQGKYNPDVFSFYRRNIEKLQTNISEEELKKLKHLVEDVVLTKFDPSKVQLTIDLKEATSLSYTTDKFVPVFGECILLIEPLEIEIKKYRQKLINYIPFAYSEYLTEIFKLITNITIDEVNSIIAIYSEKRSDDLDRFQPNNFVETVKQYKIKSAIPILKKFVDNEKFDFHVRENALKVIGTIDPDEIYLCEIFEKYAENGKKLRECANEILIKTFENNGAIQWRINELVNRAFCFVYQEGAHWSGKEEIEISGKSFARPIMQLFKPIYIDEIRTLVEAGFEIYDKGLEYHEYAQYLWKVVAAYFDNLKETKTYSHLHKLIGEVLNKYSDDAGLNNFLYIFESVKQNYLEYLGKPLNFNDCIKKYNTIKAMQYINISNSHELYDVIIDLLNNDFKNWVENEGAYKFIQEAKGNQETLIQKTIKTQIENLLLKKGVRNIDIRREEQLLDDKRTDIIISYGFIQPILLELKRVDNTEICNDTARYEYRKKLIQYINGTNSAYGIFLVFQINEKCRLEEYLPKLEATYQNDANINIVGCNCVKSLPACNTKRKRQSAN